MRLRYLLIAIFLLLACLKSLATHMSGGEIYWECIGPNEYRIRLVVYRDCAGINVDPSYNLQLTSPCGNRNLTVTTNGGVEISQLCDIELPNSTCNGGTLPGIQQYEYTGTIILPPCDSWSIRWTNIYRNNAIVNLTNPGTREMFIESVMNTAAAPCNDSPEFTNTAIPYVCLGYPITYSYGAYDPEADSLSYSLIGARMAGGAAIPYVVPHTPAEPIPGMVLDPTTGLIEFTLSTAGNWVVVVQVTQYDENGNVIGTIMRDMQFVAYPCSNIPPDPATGLVDGLTGTANQTGPRSVQVCRSGDFCFDMVISDPNATNVLTAFSNIQQNLPGATFTYTGTNPITAQVCWNADEDGPGFFPFIVNVNDGACPIPAFQTYVYTIEVLPGLFADLDIVDETCDGDQDGSITVNVTEGASPYTYLWNTGSTDPQINEPPGDYSVIVEDANGCVSDTLAGTIANGPLQPTADAGGDMVACYDQLPFTLNGAVTEVSGGTWSGGTGEFTGTGLNVQYTPGPDEIAAGSVQLTLTSESNGCPVATDQITVTLPNNFANTSITAQDATCFELQNGWAAFEPNDPQFTYLWDDPAAQTTATATGLGAGTYTVLVTDQYGCTTTLSADVGPAEPVTIADVIVTDETCAGAGDGAVQVIVTGGTGPYTYEWSNGMNGPIITAGAGTITVSVIDANGCAPAIADATIGSQAQPNEADAGADLFVCMDEMPVPLNGIVVNATGGTWSGGSGQFTGTWPNVLYMPSAADIDAGEVLLTLTTTGNNNCPPASDVMSLQIPNSFANTTIAATDASCSDVNDGQVAITPADPSFTYSWDDPAAQTTATAIGLGAGTYTATITDPFGCSIQLSADVGPPGPVSIVDLTAVDETCLGVGDGSATVLATGGTPPYSYLWSNGSTDPTINAATGDYSVTITDANGCTPAVGQITIGTGAYPNEADAGNDQVACMDDLSVQLNGTVVNATSGAWSGGTGQFIGSGISVIYQPSANDVAAGTVTLNFTTIGNTGCPPASDEMTIAIPNSFANGAITTIDATCYELQNGQASFTPADPTFTYLWNDPAAQTTPTALGLGAGNYILTVSDAFGCSSEFPAFIGPTSPLAIADITSINENCLGSGDGQAMVQVEGGTAPYTYLWSTGATAPAITATSGTYSVQVSDANNCAPVSGQVTIDPTGLPNMADAGADMMVCLNDYPIQLQGAVTNATTGEWSGGSGAFSGSGSNAQYWPTINEIMAGSVELVLTTTDNTTCPSASDTVAILLSNTLLTAELSSNDAQCNGSSDGSLSFTPADPSYIYTWNVPGINGPAPTGLPAGDYTLTVSDGSGCDTEFHATIGQPDELMIASISTTDVICFGQENGQAQLQLQGGTAPFIITWDNGSMGATVNDLPAGTNIVSVIDSHGCTLQDSAIITQPDPIELQVSIPDTVCMNAPVNMSAQAQGGNGGFIFEWSGIGTGSEITAEFDQSQFVVVTVQDQAGCAGPPSMQPIYVLNISLADLNAYGDTLVCPGETVTFGATLEGYPGAYSISWPTLGNTGSGPFSFPLNSSMNVPVIASNTCGQTLIDTIQLHLDIPPGLTLPPIIAQGCAPLTVQMPTLPLQGVTWLWDLGNGQTSTAMAPTVTYPAGTYTIGLTISTPFGCTSSATTTGTVIAHSSPVAAFTPSAYLADLNASTIHFTDQSTGDINIYSWSFGDGGTSAVSDPVHTYDDIGNHMVTLVVESANGCTSTATEYIQITPVYDVTLPNAFSPNTNGGNGGGYSPIDLTNDVFYAFVRNVDEFRMRIFNRWGELVFESNDLMVGWDGYYKGQLSPQDVYVVQTWIRFVDGREIKKLSDLTLLR